jgi:hypothetical protein
MNYFDETLQDLKRGNVLERAAAIALEDGDVEGSHHKQWVIDQMLRVICGERYSYMIALYESNGREWDTGIAP